MLLPSAGEKEAAAKKQQKAEKKVQKEAALKLAGTSKPIAKKRKGGIRLRKGVRVKGIKIVDAASKRQARELLKGGVVDREMEDADVPAKKLSANSLKRKLKKSKASAADAPTPME